MTCWCAICVKGQSLFVLARTKEKVGVLAIIMTRDQGEPIQNWLTQQQKLIDSVSHCQSSRTIGGRELRRKSVNNNHVELVGGVVHIRTVFIASIEVSNLH